MIKDFFILCISSTSTPSYSRYPTPPISIPNTAPHKASKKGYISFSPPHHHSHQHHPSITSTLPSSDNPIPCPHSQNTNKCQCQCQSSIPTNILPSPPQSPKKGRGYHLIQSSRKIKTHYVYTRILRVHFSIC